MIRTAEKEGSERDPREEESEAGPVGTEGGATSLMSFYLCGSGGHLISKPDLTRAQL